MGIYPYMGKYAYIPENASIIDFRLISVFLRLVALRTNDLAVPLVMRQTGVNAVDGRILNKVVRMTDAGVELEADPRHAELVVKELGLEGAKASQVPCSKDTNGGASKKSKRQRRDSQ